MLTATTASSPNEQAPVRLGVITDIQYADKPDHFIDYVGKFREFSKILAKTEFAVDHFNDQSLTAVIHLGDIVDGNVTLDQTHCDLDQVLQRLRKLQFPLFHVLGNHCLEAGRSYLIDKLNLSKGSYYFHDLSPQWRLIVLDTVDKSIQREEEHPCYKLAQDYLKEHDGEPNAVGWNGGLGPEQMEWLRQILADTKKQRRWAVVCGHLPVLEEASCDGLVAWDAQDLEKLLVSSGVVKAYLCGHHHDGGYAWQNGIHHVTFEAVIDSDDDRGAAGVVSLTTQCITIRGLGSVTSRVLPL